MLCTPQGERFCLKTAMMHFKSYLAICLLVFERQDCIVVGISFEGIYFAYRLAQTLKAPLAFLFTSLF